MFPKLNIIRSYLQILITRGKMVLFSRYLEYLKLCVTVKSYVILTVSHVGLCQSEWYFIRLNRILLTKNKVKN